MVIVPYLLRREQLNQHLDSVQGDLDTLKEFLRNEDYSLDANALLGVSTTDTHIFEKKLQGHRCHLFLLLRL